MLGKDFYAYLDDSIICVNNQFANLGVVFFKLEEAGLKAKLTKGEFLKAKITFSDHTVDGNENNTILMIKY